MKFLKKNTIKIPKDVKIIYFKKNEYLLILGPLDRKIVKVNFKIYLSNKKNILYITNNSITKNLDNLQKRNIKSLRKNLNSKIKQNILESSITINKRLKLVGVGLKVFRMDKNLIHLKLGFSHSIYHKIPKKIEIKTGKLNSIFIFGNSIQIVTQLACNIKSYKKPEPYKGKGILYYNEKIKLKQGKKL